METANIYAGILKYDKNDDGTLTVYGKATDDSIDIDQQICDPAWLDKAMPEWFMTGGNIREQHSNIAAGVAKEYEQKSDGHYISALVVDPVSVKKVENRVLRGFSIGIKAPRVVRDQKAANGRIIDGQIVEVSLVDRPANPNCQLVLAKSIEGEKTLMKTEELIEKHGDHDQSDHNPHGGGGSSEDKPSGNSGSSREQTREEAEEEAEVQFERGRDDKEVDTFHDGIVDVHDEFDEYLDDLDEGRQNNDDDDEEQGRITERAQSALQEAQGHFDDATRPGLTFEEHADLIESAASKLEEAIDALSYGNGSTQALQGGIRQVLGDVNNYLSGLDKSATIKETPMRERKTRARKSARIKKADGMPMGGESNVVPSRDEMTKRYADARKALDEVTRMCKAYGYEDIEKQYGETAEQETAEGSYPNAAEEEVSEARGEKPLDKELVDDNGNEMDKSAMHKCLECGCNMPANSHGNPNVSTAVMVTPNEIPVPTPKIQPPTPKSVGTIVPPATIEEIGTVTEDEDSDEDDSLDKSLLADVNITDIVEKAVKSAMSGISAEVALLKSAKEAVENKAAQLETELATAKSLAIGGGPKRTTIATGSNKPNEWKSKADLYFAKASATTDNDLAKGYREMAKDFLAKAEVEA